MISWTVDNTQVGVPYGPFWTGITEFLHSMTMTFNVHIVYLFIYYIYFINLVIILMYT